MRKQLVTSAFVILLALCLIPTVFSARPPPGPPYPESWPDPQYIPISYYEFRDYLIDVKGMTMIETYGGDHDLEAGQPFFLNFRWLEFITNVVYDAETGDEVPPFESLQDQTGSVYPGYRITLNGQPLHPNLLKVTVKWLRFYNDADYYHPPYPSDWPQGDWAVAPMATVFWYWVEFPEGLPADDYTVVLTGDPAGWQGRPDAYQPFGPFVTTLDVT